jgi:S-adenosylmethionine hydrolase
VTNLTAEVLTGEMIASGAQILIKRRVVREFRQYFSQNDNDAPLFAVWGSAGFLEIASRNRSAAKLLKAKRGDRVTVTGI